MGKKSSQKKEKDRVLPKLPCRTNNGKVNRNLPNAAIGLSVRGKWEGKLIAGGGPQVTLPKVP